MREHPRVGEVVIADGKQAVVVSDGVPPRVRWDRDRRRIVGTPRWVAPLGADLPSGEGVGRIEALPDTPLEIGEGLLDFGALFRGPGTFVGSRTRREVSLRELGALRLSSRLVACDPALAQDALPLDVELPPGRYPVIAAVTEDRVAAVMLRLGPIEGCDWQPLPLSDGSPAHGVDSGRSCLADLDALADPAVRRRMRGGLAVRSGDETVAVCFDAGWGDGAYASYAARDRDGQLCAVVTDFGLLYDSPRCEIVFPGVRAWREGALILAVSGVAITFRNYVSRFALDVVGPEDESWPVRFDESPFFVDASGERHGCWGRYGPDPGRPAHVRAHTLYFWDPVPPDARLYLPAAGGARPLVRIEDQ